MTISDTRTEGWTAACPVDTMVPGRGVAVLLDDGTQVAVFLLGDGSVHGVGNIDPFGCAAVMSRGIVGDRAGEPTVASPLLKQVFSLLDGRCLDDSTFELGTFPVRKVDGVFHVQSRIR